MKWPVIVPLVVLAACARITQDNYLRIDEGMIAQQVTARVKTDDQPAGQ
jgi:hypothetical protein